MGRHDISQEPAGVVAHRDLQPWLSLVAWAERASSIVYTQNMIDFGIQFAQLGRNSDNKTMES